MASAEKASKYLSLVQEAFRKGAKSTVMDDADFEQKHPRAKGGLFAKKGRVSVANGSDEDEESAYLDIVNRPDANERTTHLAPNGKRSNLTNALYHLVRTKRFKDWFGDWERKAVLDCAVDFALNGNPVVSITGSEFAQTGQHDLIDRVAAFYSRIGGKVRNPEIGDVVLDRDSVRSSLGHGIGREKAAAFAAVPEVIRNGFVFDRQENWKGRGINSFVLVAPIKIGNENYVCEAIVEQKGEGKERRFYLHEVNLQSSLSDTIKTPTGGASIGKPSRPVRSILAKLISEVNGESVSKVVDENGEPLVVSHASNEMFNSFDLSKFGKNDWGFYGAGFYFSTTTAHERQYGKINRHFFLNIRNPFDFTSAGQSEIGDYYGGIGKLNTYEARLEYARSFTDKIVKRGYDGASANYGIEYIAYNPSQIKSADPVTYDDAGNVIPLSKRFNFSSVDIRDEATGRILDIIKNVDAEDASLEWTSGKNPEIQRYRGKRQPIDRVPKKITKQIIVENCKLIKTVDEKLLPLLAGKVYGMLTGKVEAEDFIDWCMDECGLEEWQAYRIARDQIVKAREWIKIADWKHRGVSYVMWCHSGKDAEPRDYHVAKWNGKSGLRNGRPNGLNGFVFNIDNPPVIDKKTGARGLPSTLIGCKCFLRGIKGI